MLTKIVPGQLLLHEPLNCLVFVVDRMIGAGWRVSVHGNFVAFGSRFITWNESFIKETCVLVSSKMRIAS